MSLSFFENTFIKSEGIINKSDKKKSKKMTCCFFLNRRGVIDVSCDDNKTITIMNLRVAVLNASD